MRYVVGGQGWWVDQDRRVNPDTPMFYPPGTVIDDSLPQFAQLAGIGPAIDAAPLDWFTYWYMTSMFGPGLGYDYTQVSTRFLTMGMPFILGQSPLGRPPIVLGIGSTGPIYKAVSQFTVGPNVDYWGRPTPWTE